MCSSRFLSFFLWPFSLFTLRCLSRCPATFSCPPSRYYTIPNMLPSTSWPTEFRKALDVVSIKKLISSRILLELEETTLKGRGVVANIYTIKTPVPSSKKTLLLVEGLSRMSPDDTGYQPNILDDVLRIVAALNNFQQGFLFRMAKAYPERVMPASFAQLAKWSRYTTAVALVLTTTWPTTKSQLETSPWWFAPTRPLIIHPALVPRFGKSSLWASLAPKSKQVENMTWHPDFEIHEDTSWARTLFFEPWLAKQKFLPASQLSLENCVDNLHPFKTIPELCA